MNAPEQQPESLAPQFDGPSSSPEDPGDGGVPDGPRSFRQVSGDVRAAQEQLLELFGDDEALVEQANVLLDELDALRREANRMIRKQAEAKVDAQVRDRAEREVMNRFLHGRPNVHVLKAETELRKVALPGGAKAARQREFDEALWRLNVAHGYATARAIETDGAVPAFRAQVVTALEGWAIEAEDPIRAAAHRFAAERVAKMVAVLPGPVGGAAETD